ncbi:MAG: hypothetical protein Q7S94_01090 [Gallionella sp.]|nr:hypothetical protein [Gallionella sp.]
MDKTRVDDMLIEMITPKVREIEEKFGRGEGLSQDDINTLLLKSQYNHINHLDHKLDEVVNSVVALEGKFAGLEGKFAGLEGKFNTFKAEMVGEFEKRMGALEIKFEQAQVKMQETIISTMKWYIGGTGLILILLKSLDIFVK